MIPEVEGSTRTGAEFKFTWLASAATLCFAYGVAFTLNIHPIGDGLWFWYARLFREHHLLYSGMHLPLQPLFVLMTAWTQQLFGVGWLASKMLAFAQLLVFCCGLWLVARRINWTDWQKALLLSAAFMMTLTADYFRLDDYHITGYCFEVFSIYLLFRMDESCLARYRVGAALLLGVLSGLSLSNRLNDGAALFAGCAIVLWFVARGSRLILLGGFCLAAAASFISIILLTGDRLQDWWLNSITRAATIKGGTGSVLKGPLHLLKWQLRYKLSQRAMLINVALIVIVVVGIVLLNDWRRDPAPHARWKYWMVSMVVLATLGHSLRRRVPGWPNITIGSYLGLLLIGVTCWALVRAVRAGLGTAQGDWHWRETLVIIPFLQMVSGGATSGMAISEILPAIGLFLLLLPLVLPSWFKDASRRMGLVVLSSVVVVSGLYFKSVHPYEWHHFIDRAIFTDRIWYRHPIYGEMYIDRSQLRLVKGICSTMAQEGTPTGMLEITNPYASWFCDVPPWHDYVQTWYDTVSPVTMQQLVQELRSDPPQWIVYQRSLETMAVHEVSFNHGKPLAHRDLDRLIVDRLAAGQWTIVYAETHLGADWYLIRTAPAPALPHN